MSLLDLCANTATVTRTTWGGTHGQRTATGTATEDLACSAQPMRADRQRLYADAFEAGVTLWTIFFAADPQLGVNDTITLDSGAVLAVLAPARNAAGRSVLWSLDARQIS